MRIRIFLGLLLLVGGLWLRGQQTISAEGGMTPPTDLTDQANGYLLIDNGSTNQQAARPVMELGILQRQNVENGVDYTYVWDNSTGQLMRTPATRASQLNYLADGVGDTRVGSLGNINTNVFASNDHRHPIEALTIPALPTFAVAGLGSAITSTAINRQRATEESIEYTVQVTVTNTTLGNWITLTAPTITGYYLAGLDCDVYLSSVATTAPYYGVQPSFVWGGTTIYVRPVDTVAKVYNINLTYILN